MKKVLSIILAICLVFTFCAPAFAKSTKCNCGMTPVVYVPGFGEPIYKGLDTDEPTTLMPPSTPAILKSLPDLIIAVFGGLLAANPRVFGTFAIRGADKLMGELACNPDGSAAEYTGVDFNPAPTEDTHKEAAFTEECGRFNFSYDWRISPIDNAEILKTYVDNVKELTGHDEVILAAHSQGNTIIATYLQIYSSKGIEKVIFLSPAYQGISLIGGLFTREVGVKNRGDDFTEYINGLIGYNDAESQLIVSLISLINSYGIFDAFMNYLQFFLDKELDRVYDELLIDLFGTMAGLWTFVPAEDYEAAKDKMFGHNPEKYAELIKKTDYYHDNVQTKLVDILKKAKANGTDIVIAAGYNISTIPVTNFEVSHSDMLIDTEYMTIGATCASYGETLGENYKQANKVCGHNHISPEKYIDASTCAFPEYTWFFSGNGHSTFDDCYNEFIEWAIRYDGQPTVNSADKYPQYMKISGGKLAPVSGDAFVETRSDEKVIFSSIITLIKDSFKK